MGFMWGDLLILMIYHCSGCFSDQNQSEPTGSDWKLVGNWSDSVLSGAIRTDPIRIWSDKLDKFPTIWVVLYSRISDWILIGIWAVLTDSTRKMWGTDKAFFHPHFCWVSHAFCFLYMICPLFLLLVRRTPFNISHCQSSMATASLVGPSTHLSGFILAPIQRPLRTTLPRSAGWCSTCRLDILATGPLGSLTIKRGIAPSTSPTGPPSQESSGRNSYPPKPKMKESVCWPQIATSRVSKWSVSI